jgi:hypothetical protein
VRVTRVQAFCRPRVPLCVLIINVKQQSRKKLVLRTRFPANSDLIENKKTNKHKIYFFTLPKKPQLNPKTLRVISPVESPILLLGNNTLQTNKLGLNLYADHDLKEITFNLSPQYSNPFFHIQAWKRPTNLFYRCLV